MRWLPIYLAKIKLSFKIKLAASQNENSRHAVDMGMDVGEPDLRLYARINNILYMFYLELKKKKGTMRESQTDWAKDYDENYKSDNTHYDVAYGFLEAREKIIKWIKTMEETQASFSPPMPAE